jgi:hypothetical protein
LTVLVGAMCEAVGHPVRLKLTGKARPSHIFPEVNIRGRGWIPVDLARPLHKIHEHRSFPLERCVNLR